MEASVRDGRVGLDLGPRVRVRVRVRGMGILGESFFLREVALAFALVCGAWGVVAMMEGSVVLWV